MADKSAFVPLDIDSLHRENDGNDINMDNELFGMKPQENTPAAAAAAASTPSTPVNAASSSSADQQPVAATLSPSTESSKSTTTAVSKLSPKKFEYKKSTTYKKTMAK